jgi:two-component system CheB/CheR fusion protein
MITEQELKTIEGREEKDKGNANAFEALLEQLKRSRRTDFTGYKRQSLMRRVTKRMQTVSISSFSDYLDYLEVHPEEVTHLFNTVLINVTSFFRDKDAWDHLAKVIEAFEKPFLST